MNDSYLDERARFPTPNKAITLCIGLASLRIYMRRGQKKVNPRNSIIQIHPASVIILSSFMYHLSEMFFFKQIHQVPSIKSDKCAVESTQSLDDYLPSLVPYKYLLLSSPNMTFLTSIETLSLCDVP